MRPLYCDESIWIPVADGLRNRGWTVHTARSEGTLGESDRDQLQYAVDRDWLFLTFDDDFLSLIEADDAQHLGVIYLQQTGRRIGDIVKAVDSHLELRDPDDTSIVYL